MTAEPRPAQLIGRRGTETARRIDTFATAAWTAEHLLATQRLALARS
jgi:hypothetical protein